METWGMGFAAKKCIERQRRRHLCNWRRDKVVIVGFFCETLGNLVQDFCSILVGKPCGLLTRCWNRRYKLLRSRGRLSSVPDSLLTLWKFLIVHGCVLFVRLGDWAERGQGWGSRKVTLLKNPPHPRWFARPDHGATLSSEVAGDN